MYKCICLWTIKCDTGCICLWTINCDTGCICLWTINCDTECICLWTINCDNGCMSLCKQAGCMSLWTLNCDTKRGAYVCEMLAAIPNWIYMFVNYNLCRHIVFSFSWHKPVRPSGSRFGIMERAGPGWTEVWCIHLTNMAAMCPKKLEKFLVCDDYRILLRSILLYIIRFHMTIYRLPS